jgi:pimeloyl-ACP methyl ester carboxylesterase
MFEEKYIKTKKGLTIYTESIGNSNNPPILLIMGALNQGLFWYDSFCKSLSDKNYFVIRYDHRDTGYSSVINYKEFPYNLNDLMEDALDIMDAYNIDKVNIIGLSMGGYIGQLIGINYPKKVNTLTLISTTSDHRPYMDATTGNYGNMYDLPYPERSFLDFIEKSTLNPPQNELDMENNQIEGWKITFNEISEKDFNEVIQLIKIANKRAKDQYSAYNHGLAVLNSIERTGLLKNIMAPTFIFHGEKDPCLPLEHGKQLHKLIKNSKFEIIKNMGHMFSITESKYISEKIIENVKEHN